MFDFSENPEQSISVSIMNTEGRVLNYVSGINSEYRLDISNYSEGLYLVRIITDNNIFTKKVLVKK
jgi:hypothetical protein